MGIYSPNLHDEINHYEVNMQSKILENSPFFQHTFWHEYITY